MSKRLTFYLVIVCTVIGFPATIYDQYATGHHVAAILTAFLFGSCLTFIPMTFLIDRYRDFAMEALQDLQKMDYFVKENARSVLEQREIISFQANKIKELKQKQF